MVIYSTYLPFSLIVYPKFLYNRNAGLGSIRLENMPCGEYPGKDDVAPEHLIYLNIEFLSVWFWEDGISLSYHDIEMPLTLLALWWG